MSIEENTDDFTKDMKILPDPEIFEERTRQECYVAVEATKEVILKALEKSTTGVVSLPDCFESKPFRRSYREQLQKWADIGGYVLEFEGPTYSTSLELSPKKKAKTKHKEEQALLNVAFTSGATFGVCMSVLIALVVGALCKFVF
jgi:hypothetical protein